MRKAVCKMLLWVSAVLTVLTFVQLGNQVTWPFTVNNCATAALATLVLAILASDAPVFGLALMCDIIRRHRHHPSRVTLDSPSIQQKPNKFGAISEPTEVELAEILRFTDRRFRADAS